MAAETRFLGYTLAAAGVGYAVGVLFAPKSGRELRQDIAAKTKTVSDQATARLSEGKEKIRSLMRRASDKTEEARHQGVEILGDIARERGAPGRAKT